MIQQILQALDAAAAQHLPVAVRHLLTEQQPTGSGIAPHVYVGNGNWNPIANDNAGTFSYWRLMSPIREQEVDAPGCFDAFQATYNLRLVSMIDRDICGDVFDATRAAATAIRNTDDDLRAALKLMLVDFSSGSVEVQSSRVYSQEFGNGLDVNPNKTLVAIDVTISVTGRSSCFEPCTPTPDFFCALIEAKTWSKIKDCMTAGQIADAIEDLCDDAPCDPLSVRVNGEPYATIADPCGGIASVEVVQGGVGVGELIGGQWVVPECPPCDDLTISINAEDGVIIVPNPCGESVAIAVTQGGLEVGTWNGTAWIIPECEDAEVTFDGLPVLTIPCGDTGNLDCGTTIESAHVTLGSSGENGIYYISGTAGGKTRYEKNATYAFEYSGTRWVMIRPGTDHQAALGNETYPWLADWTGQAFVVDEGTISQYCGGNIEPCADLTIAINGTTYGTVADPCGATAPVNVHDSNGNDVGSLVSGAWVVAAPANVLREYTASDTWNKPASSSFVGAFVVCVGAGAGGACGDLRTGTTVQATGGWGGGGGWVVWDFIAAASLSGTEAVTVPAGGAGAAGLTVAGAGIGGTNGGDASFGAHVIALGGRAGNGSPQGRDITSCTPRRGSNILPGHPSMQVGNRFGQAGFYWSTDGLTSYVANNSRALGGTAGGNGGLRAVSATPGVFGNGQVGGTVWNGTTLTGGGAASAGVGTNGGNGTGNIVLTLLSSYGLTTTNGAGGGGGGGASGNGIAANAGNGGTGAIGAGGGGGGGGTSGIGDGISGDGGNGGAGIVYVYEIYKI
jgi:hypothetical protein